MENAEFTHETRSEADGAVTVLRLHGVLNGHRDCYAWLEEMRRGVQAGRNRLILNLEGVSRIDSTGIGIIAAIQASVMNGEGMLCLTGLGDRIRRLLETTYLLKVIQSAPDEAKAIRVVAGGE